MPPHVSAGEWRGADVATALQLATSPGFLRTLDRLQFTARHSVGRHPGSMPVAAATQLSGLEVAAHKPYAPGDDLRHIDWNALARLDQRVIKTFRAEREAPLHLLLDASASMGIPAADAKLALAAALSLALAYIALRAGHPVRIAVLGGESGGRLAPFVRHVSRLPELQAFLAPLSGAGPTRLAEGVDAYLRATRVPGTAIVLSDFLVEPAGWQAALDQLRGRDYDVAALRLIGPGERDATALPRRVRLRDAESGRERDFDLTDTDRRRYADAVAAHLDLLRHWCARRAVSCAIVDTALELRETLVRTLPRAGLLQ